LRFLLIPVHAGIESEVKALALAFTGVRAENAK